MRITSRTVLVIAALLTLAGAVGVVAFLLVPSAEPTCHDRLTSGPNSNTSRLDTTLHIAPQDWPELAGVLRAFANENHWDLREGVGTAGEPYANLCDPSASTIRVFRSASGEVLIQIIYMVYVRPGRDGWQPIYRDLHARLETRWPGKMTYVEGEFGQTVPRPPWLGPAPGSRP